MANEQEVYQRLKEACIKDAMLVLKVTESGDETRRFFEMCIKEAQRRDAEENAGSIMNAFEAALKKQAGK
jgi:hypothetical protein